MSTSFTENILLRVVIHVMSVGVGLVGLLVEYWCTYFIDFLWCIDINTSTKHWEPVYKSNQIKSVYWLIIVTVTIFTKRERKYYINNNIKHSYY